MPITTAETTTAAMLTSPPQHGRPPLPATPRLPHAPAMAAIAIVAPACHFKTRRIGLVESGASITALPALRACTAPNWFP